MLQLARIAAAQVANALTNKLTIFFDLDNKLKTKNSSGVVSTIVTQSADGTSSARPYKVYTALLTQSGTNAPVATVLENTLGGEVVWQYIEVGDYNANLIGSFTENKTVVYFGSINTSSSAASSWNNIDSIGVYTAYDDSENPPRVYSNNILLNTPIEIRVYP